MFCFTPKGRLIALPRGATPIDFAYAVHTDVGNTASAAKINGRMAPLLTELAERRRGRDHPRRRRRRRRPPGNRSSSPARRAPRSAAPPRAAVRRQYAGLGRQILERAFERAGKTLIGRQAQGRAAAAGTRHRSTTCSPRSGAARCSPATWCKAVYPDYKEERRAPGARGERRAAGSASPRAASIKIKLPSGRTSGGESAHPDPRPRRRPAGALRPRRRRRAGRPHRRHPDPRRRGHDLSDPVAGARRLRQRARALARRALGHRPRGAAALPGPARAAIASTSRARSRRSPR